MIRGTINQAQAIPSDKHGHPLGTFPTPQDWVGDKQEIRRLVDVADALGIKPPIRQLDTGDTGFDVTSKWVCDGMTDNGVSQVRKFDTGATRDTDAGKLDFDGFLSPYALRAFAEYMHRHRQLPDGSLRASDNWACGIPLDAYMKSMWRHFFDVWSEHRGVSTPAGLKENLCALKFNVDGMLHELVKAEHDHTPGAGYAMPLADKED